MTADEFATLVRSGNGSVRVSNAVLRAEGFQIRGQGLLKITPERLALHFEPSSKTAMPRRQKSIWSAKDFWSLSGTIERDLRFSCDRVWPGQRTDHWKTRKAPQTTQVLLLSHLELQTAGWDKLTDAQKLKAAGLPPGKRAKFPTVVFEAVLMGCEQIFINAGTDTKI